MTRAVYAPGGSGTFNPAREAGGYFAEFIQGHTPKYAFNAGFRQDLYRNTLARMLVRVDRAEMQQFVASISDEHTRRQLANRIAGDPTLNRNTSSNGYLDFYLQQVQHTLQEKIQVQETLSDNYVAYTFGQSPPVWNYTGFLLNTVQDDHASNFFRLYVEILRATALARRQKTINLSYDSYIVSGAMTNINMSLSSNMESMWQLSFQLLVKKVGIINYTSGWVPTRANTPFAADVNAVAYDGRPQAEASVREIAIRNPENTEPITQVDPRVYSTPPTTEAPVTRNTQAASVVSSRPETVNASFSTSPDVQASRP